MKKLWQDCYDKILPNVGFQFVQTYLNTQAFQVGDSCLSLVFFVLLLDVFP